MMGVVKQVPKDLRWCKKWWWCILPIIMVDMKLYKSVKSTKIGVGHWQWWSSLLFLFACQVLEYHPHPWDQWVSIGDLVHARRTHATLSIGVEQLPCFSGESFNIEMILWWCEKRRLIDKQRGFNNDNEFDDNQQWYHNMISYTGCHQWYQWYPPIIIFHWHLSLIISYFSNNW